MRFEISQAKQIASIFDIFREPLRIPDMDTKGVAVLVIVSSLIAGCGGGGGGGGGGMVAPATSIPVRLAIKNLYTVGYQKSGTVTGTATNASNNSYPVSGSFTTTASPNGSTQFNGQTANGLTVTLSESLVFNGQTSTASENGQSFISADYTRPLGSISTGQYCVVTTTTAYPVTVSLGQSGNLATSSCYTDATMKTAIGTNQTSYLVIPGVSAGALILAIINSTKDTSGNFIGQSTANYTVDTSGNMAFFSGSGATVINSYVLNLTQSTQ